MLRRRMLKVALLLPVALVLASLRAEEPPPTPADLPTLELRANQAFERGDWAEALPLLKQLAVRLKDDKERVGPVLEKIRVAESNLPEAAVKDTPLSRNRKPHPPLKKDEIRELSIKELGNFDYDPDLGGVIPDDVKALNGGQVRLRGFMIPLDQARRITRFALVPDLFACCFGQPPGLQHTIIVRCPAGMAVSYYPEEIVVLGRLTVQEKTEDGFVVSLFELDASSVKPAPQ